MPQSETTPKVPAHIQVTPLQGGLWEWSVCFFGCPNRDGIIHSWEAALEAIKEAIAKEHRS